MQSALTVQKQSSMAIVAPTDLSYTDVTDMVLAGKAVAAIDAAAGTAQGAAIRALRIKTARKLEELMKEVDAEMESINKHARVDHKEAFTLTELNTHFKDLFLQQVTVRLKGYAHWSRETNDYPTAKHVDNVPLTLLEYLSDPDSDDDDEFKDTSGDVLDECSDEESDTPSAKNVQRVLEATADGKRFKAGVLKVATVSFVVATRNAKEFQLMCERDASGDRSGGFQDIEIKLTRLAVEIGGLDKRFTWHLHSSSSDISSPFSMFQGVAESNADVTASKPHHCMHTHNWVSAIFGMKTGPKPPTAMRAIHQHDAVDAVIFAPELSSAGTTKLFTRHFGESYPLLQSKRSNEEYDDHEDA
jgi:hypothetical protein